MRIKEVGSREPLKVLELGSDVCTPGLWGHDWCVSAGLEKEAPRGRKIV